MKPPEKKEKGLNYTICLYNYNKVSNKYRKLSYLNNYSRLYYKNKHTLKGIIGYKDDISMDYTTVLSTLKHIYG